MNLTRPQREGTHEVVGNRNTFEFAAHFLVLFLSGYNPVNYQWLGQLRQEIPLPRATQYCHRPLCGISQPSVAIYTIGDKHKVACTKSCKLKTSRLHVTSLCGK